MSRQAGSIVRGNSKPRRISVKAGRQQGRQGSNLRQPVLETGTLPTELHPCGNQASPLISAVSSIGQGQIASAKQLTPCSTQLFCVKLGHTPMISIRPTTRARGRE